MKKLLLIIVSILSLVACLQKLVVMFEVITPEPLASGAEMTFASPTPYVAGTETALANSSPTPLAANPAPLPTFVFTQAITVKPTDFSPVLYGNKYDANTFFLLLGGVSRDSWLIPDTSVARFAGEATYALHTFKYAEQYFFWGKAPEPFRTCQAYLIGTDVDVNEPGMVATLDGWNITKRDVTELSADAQLYRKVVSDWLITEGVPSPQIDFIQVFRTDLEGDGADEVFINATHLDGSQRITKAGDYSIVLMRKVQGNDAITTFIAGDVYHSQAPEVTFPRTYSIANFIDLNQDGTMEVIVGFVKWESFGAAVYQIDGQNVTKALHAEC